MKKRTHRFQYSVPPHCLALSAWRLRIQTRTNPEREGNAPDIRQRRTGMTKNTGRKGGMGRRSGVALTSTSMATRVLVSLPDTILRRANAASGIRIARPAINLLQANAVRCLAARGSSAIPRTFQAMYTSSCMSPSVPAPSLWSARLKSLRVYSYGSSWNSEVGSQPLPDSVRPPEETLDRTRSPLNMTDFTPCKD